MAKHKIDELLLALNQRARVPLTQLPTPIHRLENFGRQLDGPELWIKRDDLTGLEGGGNKTRKLEFLVGDAIQSGADMLVTAGAIQSNHTRQTAAAAAKSGLRCALLHFGWTKDAGPQYRQSGNILLSSLMGAELYLDDAKRPIEDQSPLLEFFENLKRSGQNPYLIPAGASERRFGSFGYMDCAAEIISADLGVYGEAEPETLAAIRLLARSEGLVADPVYEGKALRGLQKLARDGRFDSNSKILLMHLGGTPAIHAYANLFGKPDFSQFTVV